MRSLHERFSAPRCEPLEPRRLLASGMPRYDHIVIVMEENRDFADIVGARTQPNISWSVVRPSQLTQAPYIRQLAKTGNSLSNMFAEAHPSQPNYLALFSGSTQGVEGDNVPAQQFTSPSLAGQLIAKGLTFAGYSEDLPQTGFLGVKSGEYARKHNPWSDFTDVPASANLPFSAFPSDYSKLPTVSFVVPNQLNDMHSGSIRAADQWLKSKIGPYAKWARAHNSLLIVSWDEGRSTNQIATIFYGSHVRRGRSTLPSDHYRILRTIESIYGLQPLGEASNRAPLRKLFSGGSPTSAPTTPQRVFSQQPITLSAWSRLVGDQLIGPLPV